MCDGTIRVSDLPERIRTSQSETKSPVEITTARSSGSKDWLSLAQIEGEYVARVLQHTRGNKQAAARVLKVDRKTLDRMIKRHNIEITRIARFQLRAHTLTLAESKPIQ
jgi:transcriptional regulator of acetoin/glycerol metabolism